MRFFRRKVFTLAAIVLAVFLVCMLLAARSYVGRITKKACTKYLLDILSTDLALVRQNQTVPGLSPLAPLNSPAKKPPIAAEESWKQSERDRISGLPPMNPIHAATSVNVTTENQATKQPVAWVEGRGLSLVQTMFERLGFVVTNEDTRNWDVIWSHGYPFTRLKGNLTKIQPHQKINHFPWIGLLVNKRDLIKLQSDFIPKGFLIPDEKKSFLEYAKKYPDMKWVQKNTGHRGIAVRTPDKIKLGGKTIVQHFIDNPLLIDGRRFDVAVYTVITSLYPLRLYVLEDTSPVRFCPKKYYPLNLDDKNTYVIKDNYMHMMQVPVLGEIYTNHSNTYKEAFNIYWRRQGVDIGTFWEKLYSVIRDVVVQAHGKIWSTIQAEGQFNNRQLFEFLRFDFILDENWKVYLMEANMSPTLSLSEKPLNKRLYEHIIAGTLKLVGVVPYSTSDSGNEAFLQVFGDWCTSKACGSTCLPQKCALCVGCLKEEDKVVIHDAYQEHINRGGFRRAFPPPMTQQEALNWSPETDTFNMTAYNDKDRLMFTWFIGMCRKHVTWCI